MLQWTRRIKLGIPTEKQNDKRLKPFSLMAKVDRKIDLFSQKQSSSSFPRDTKNAVLTTRPKLFCE